MRRSAKPQAFRLSPPAQTFPPKRAYTPLQASHPCVPALTAPGQPASTGKPSRYRAAPPTRASPHSTGPTQQTWACPHGSGNPPTRARPHGSPAPHGGRHLVSHGDIVNSPPPFEIDFSLYCVKIKRSGFRFHCAQYIQNIQNSEPGNSAQFRVIASCDFLCFPCTRTRIYIKPKHGAANTLPKSDVPGAQTITTIICKNYRQIR